MVTFTEEIPDEKLNFLCTAMSFPIRIYERNPQKKKIYKM